jgi:hypothetical protein
MGGIMKLMKCILIGMLVFFNGKANAFNNLPESQAIYIYNFTRYIQWPEYSMGEKFVIAVYGESDVYEQLIKYTKDRKIGNKAIAIIKIRKVEDINKYQIVFVSNDQNHNVSAIRKFIGEHPCLIVSETEGSNNAGSIIEFSIKENKLNFRIDQISAKQQKLIVNSKLLLLSV